MASQQGAQQGALKAHVSYSQLTAMTECPKRFQLLRVVGVPEGVPWLAGLAGRAVHRATEDYDRWLLEGAAA